MAIPRLLTYQLSNNQTVKIGQRVLVNVGKKKEYSAIVFKIHFNKPSYLKKIIDVINENPIIHSKQLNLWSWMSRYYMTSVGEIMIAALPASLKLQSESVYLPNSKFYSDNKLQKLKLQEQTIIDALEHNEKLSLKEISEILDLKFPHIYIQNF